MLCFLSYINIVYYYKLEILFPQVLHDSILHAVVKGYWLAAENQ